MQGILPLVGGLILYFLGGYSLWEDYDVNTGNSYTTFPPCRGCTGRSAACSSSSSSPRLIGVPPLFALRISMPPFFKRQTLTRATPTLVPDTDLAPPPSGAVG